MNPSRMRDEEDASVKEQLLDAEAPIPEQPNVYSYRDIGQRPARERSNFKLLVILGTGCLVLLLSNLWLLNSTRLLRHQLSPSKAVSVIGLDVTLQSRVEGYKTHQYAHNDTRDAAWGAFNDAHGLIALDKNWAKAHELPESTNWRNDTSKDVYVISAYHALHCVAWLRRWMLASVQGQAMDVKQQEHMHHCFETVRAELMCTADDTPLVVSPHSVGAGQVRQCRDWAPIRDYATEHTVDYISPDFLLPGQNIYSGHQEDGDGMIIPDNLL